MKQEAGRIFLSRLPISKHVLLGREGELSALDEAWRDENLHIVTLVAGGGIGKTALVSEWLQRMETEDYRGAERVYGWSFYSQGTSEDRQISSDEFLYDALKFFGDPAHKQGSASDKGKRLARLVRQRRTLLILDGLEPLQYPPGERHCQLKDQGIRALLEELALYQPGLCLVTTRLKIVDIEDAVNSSVKRIYLGPLSPEVGARLLKELGVKGPPGELLKTAIEFQGHALALSLLGKYLAIEHDGDISQKSRLPKSTDPDNNSVSRHARRVMESYVHLLSGKPELNILYMLGLFDRPADEGAIDALRTEAPIEGVTTDVEALSEERWQEALKHLRDLNLLTEIDELDRETLDCHPLVREYFGERLREANPVAWKEAHSFLYEYYKELPGKRYPETLADMEPLFAAITHGCQAGRHQEALDEVYWERIRRGNKAYCNKTLGAVGADLAALSDFFDGTWQSPTSGLNDLRKALVLSWVGTRLRPQGRLRESAQAIKAALEAFVSQENWKEAAVNASNLSEIFLTLGEVSNAVESARKGVKFADRSEQPFQQIARRADLADTLHQAGRLTDAEELFHEVENMQEKRQPDYPILYSLQGFQYCDLLLTLGNYKEVQKRVEQTLEWVTQAGWLLDIAMDELALGKAHQMQILNSDEHDELAFMQALEYLDLAVAGLRGAGSQHHLPRGLLARAAVFREQGEYDIARKDLEEIREITQRGNMNIYLADYHLESSRLLLAENKGEEAREHLDIAGKMIDDMGYHRRDNELKELVANCQALA
ncbi:MAG: hypothetical protein GY757_51515 [bacterium]|nr:hypothetical protein [bacterium]